MKRRIFIILFINVVVLFNCSAILFAHNDLNENSNNEETEFHETGIMLNDVSEMFAEQDFDYENTNELLVGNNLVSNGDVIYIKSNTASTHTKEQIIAKDEELTEKFDSYPLIFDVEPLDSAPYRAGVLKEQIQKDTINQINFFRWLYGFNNTITIKADSMENNSKGAVLLSAINELTHYPTKPDDMDEEFYNEAYSACNQSNCAWGSGMTSSVLLYVDDSKNRQPNVGHRQSILDLNGNQASFGKCDSYSTLAIHSGKNELNNDDFYSWPSAGYFPTNYIYSDTLWSIAIPSQKYKIENVEVNVSYNNVVYNVSDIKISPWYDCYTLYFPLPKDLINAGFKIEPGSRINVEVKGIKDSSSKNYVIQYTTEFFGMSKVSYVILDRTYVNIEAGNSTKLTATVYPEDALNKNVKWSCSDESIASVDQNGVVLAKKSGTVKIIVTTESGNKTAVCNVNVSSPKSIKSYSFSGKYYADNNPDLKKAFGYNEEALRNHYLNFGIKEGRQASPVFNPQYYLERYSDLKNVFGNSYEAVYNHFINFGLKEGRQGSKEFYSVYYLNEYTDLKKAFGNNYEAVANHFVNFGRFEGRVGSKETPINISGYMFDSDLYYSLYPDLQKAIGNNSTALKNHYLNWGCNEGRIASYVFDAKYYLANNSDVKKAFGNNYKAAYNHFINYGINEGRVASKYFDAKYYLNNNADLKNAFETDYSRALEHFVYFGINEGRVAIKNFNVKAYKNNNGDLSKAFGNQWKQYYRHYIIWGQKENRRCV